MSRNELKFVEKKVFFLRATNEEKYIQWLFSFDVDSERSSYIERPNIHLLMEKQY